MDISAIPEWAQWQFTDEQISAAELLYESIPDKYDNIMFKDKTLPEQFIDTYNELPVQPFIKKINLNSDPDAHAKNAYVIGVNIPF